MEKQTLGQAALLAAVGRGYTNEIKIVFWSVTGATTGLCPGHHYWQAGIVCKCRFALFSFYIILYGYVISWYHLDTSVPISLSDVEVSKVSSLQITTSDTESWW